MAAPLGLQADFILQLSSMYAHSDGTVKSDLGEVTSLARTVERTPQSWSAPTDDSQKALYLCTLYPTEEQTRAKTQNPNVRRLFTREALLYRLSTQGV